MIRINFKSRYKIVHFTNEIGKYIAGGITTFINQIYSLRNQEIGFVHIYDNEYLKDIDLSYYPGKEDILTISYNEKDRIKEIDFDIAVIHFYGLSFMFDDEILKEKKVIYVVHSVPTTEPYTISDPYGGNIEIKEYFERFCFYADVIICVSNAEKEKLKMLYPELEKKIHVIHNGMYFDDVSKRSIKDNRKKFGFIGRLDYRKGLLECIKELKNIEAKLYIACDNSDPWYLSSILDYIEAADISEKINFCGWCQGERKKSFFNYIDALIIPSLYEPFGYVALEAINYNVPIISSNNGGIGEIIGDYKYSFNPYKIGELEEKIKMFQRDSKEEIEEELEKLKKRKELFTLENMISKYNEIYSLI